MDFDAWIMRCPATWHVVWWILQLSFICYVIDQKVDLMKSDKTWHESSYVYVTFIPLDVWYFSMGWYISRIYRRVSAEKKILPQLQQDAENDIENTDPAAPRTSNGIDNETAMNVAITNIIMWTYLSVWFFRFYCNTPEKHRPTFFFVLCPIYALLGYFLAVSLANKNYGLGIDYREIVRENIELRNIDANIGNHDDHQKLLQEVQENILSNG